MVNKQRYFLRILVISIFISIINGYVHCEKQEFTEENEWFQTGNTLSLTPLFTKESQYLEDNRIGTDLLSYDPGYHNPDVVYPIGFKWMRISGNRDPLNWQNVETANGTYSIDSAVDEIITQYTNNGINIVLNLGIGAGEKVVNFTNFRTEGDIQRYSNFVRFMVHHFKDRIRYYEIWNEPDCVGCPWGGITLEDYVNLVKLVVPVIREEFSEAKIVIGAISANWLMGYPGYGEYARLVLNVEYLKALLKSGVASIVDVISFHPLYGIRPDDSYYQNYSQMIEEIKKLATSEGFKGDYLVEEIVWRTTGDPADTYLQRVSDVIAAKYFLRSIVMNRGLNLTVSIALPGAHILTQKVKSIRNICNIMASAKSIKQSIEIQSKLTKFQCYSFSLSNSNTLIALWTDDVAVDEDPGIKGNLTCPNLINKNVTAIDILESFHQPIIVNIENKNLIIQNLIIRDYPLVLLLSNYTSQSQTSCVLSNYTSQSQTSYVTTPLATPSWPFSLIIITIVIILSLRKFKLKTKKS